MPTCTSRQRSLSGSESSCPPTASSPGASTVVGISHLARRPPARWTSSQAHRSLVLRSCNSPHRKEAHDPGRMVCTSVAGCFRCTALVGVLVSIGALVTMMTTGSQAAAEQCRSSSADCTAAATGMNVAVPVLALVGCLVVLAVGRSLRPQCAALMHRSALRAAETVRAQLQRKVVLLSPLTTRQRWLLRAAERMLEHYPPPGSSFALWDIARRVDAAAELRKRVSNAQWQRPADVAEAAALAERLDAQAEADVAAMRSAVLAAAPYQHRQSHTDSPLALLRSSSLASVVMDAELLLPGNWNNDPKHRSQGCGRIHESTCSPCARARDDRAASTVGTLGDGRGCNRVAVPAAPAAPTSCRHRQRPLRGGSRRRPGPRGRRRPHTRRLGCRSVAAAPVTGHWSCTR